MILRDYQDELDIKIYSAWQIIRNVIAVLPTGGGKTVSFSNVLHKELHPACAVAHRQELVGQISTALTKFGVPHRIIAQRKTIKQIVAQQMDELGTSTYHPNALKAVAGVDTLIRAKNLDRWLPSVKLWIMDEAHHVLRENKWGKAVALFPNARGLGVTATPCRADGKGLGRHADGVFDYLAIGPGQRELIRRGYLTDYRIFCPPTDLDLSNVAISDVTGDYNTDQLRKAVHKSRIVGDIVESYKKYAAGKLGICFTVDVESASNTAERFNAAGVPSAVISSKTPDATRVELLKRFRRREILMLVNVDLFGEGFDVPAVEVVIMGRPTESFVLYAQQFGRALRIMEDKYEALIIDHVGNVVRHGLPDAKREWTLNRRERKARGKLDPGVIPMKACPECAGAYEAFYKSCPYCGYVPLVIARSTPEEVEGDLIEMDPVLLARMRGEIEKVDRHPDEVKRLMLHGGAPSIAAMGAAKNHRLRSEAQQGLREAIAQWAGYQKAAGRDDSQSYRLFYHLFGLDVLTAQTLGKREAEELTSRVRKYYGIAA